MAGPPAGYVSYLTVRNRVLAHAGIIHPDDVVDISWLWPFPRRVQLGLWLINPGGQVFVPAGTHTSAVAVTINKDDVRLIGAGRATILEFTGATDGIVFDNSSSQRTRISVEHLTIRTTNAGGLRAIELDGPTNGPNEIILRDILIDFSGSGRWTHGIFADNWQTSYVYALKIEQSATVGVRLQNSSNALSFFGTEIVGTSGAGTINRAIEFNGITDSFWFGGTLQGNFEQSLINLDTVSNSHFYGFHLENTDGSPSDGTDVVVTGGVNASFDGMQGGSWDFGTAAGSLRNCSLVNSEVGSIVLGANAQSCIISGVRSGSITDNGTLNHLLANSNAAGLAFASKIPTDLLKSNTSTIPTSASAGPAVLKIENAGEIYALDSGGTARIVWIPMSGADTTFIQYLAGNLLRWRNTSNVNKMVLSDTELALESGVQFEIGDGGIDADGDGYKHKRGTAGCATAATIGATCTTTVTWDTTIADTNYSVSCWGVGTTSGVPVNGAQATKAAASIQHTTVALTAVAAQFVTVECKAVHD